MTCREKLAIEHPEKFNRNVPGGIVGCPHHHDYLDHPRDCHLYYPYQTDDMELRNKNCTRCWNREIPE